MPILYMVRHGRVCAESADELNPQLSPEGHSQAAAVALELSARLPGPLPIVTSPMRRCRETASPLSTRWRTEPLLDPRLAEIPAPPPAQLARKEWIQRSLQVDWHEFMALGGSLQSGFDAVMEKWRQQVIESVLAFKRDTVIFSHFVPLNVLAGHATGSQRVTCFLPDHTSITVFETSGSDIRLLERGRESRARVRPAGDGAAPSPS